MQNRQPHFPPLTLEAAHEPVSSAGVAATVGVNLDSSPAGVGLALGVLLPVWRALGRAAVSDGVHRLPSPAGADGVRSDWDRGCQSTRYGLAWAKAGISAASSLSRSKSRTTPSSFRISALAGVQPSGPCGPHAPRLTAPIGSRAGYSSSSESSASLAPLSCSLQDRVTWDGSPLTSWLMAAQSNMRLQGWKSRWNRKPRPSSCWARLDRLSSRQVRGWELAA